MQPPDAPPPPTPLSEGPAVPAPAAGLGPKTGRWTARRRTAGGHLARITAPLRTSRDYRRYFIATQATSAGAAIQTGAVAFTILGTGAGAGGIAMVLLAQMLVQIVLMPLGGTFADRLPRVKVLVAGQLLVGVLAAVQTALAAAGQARVWNLTLIGALAYTVVAFSTPARDGLVKSLVPAHQLREANALAKLSHYGLIMFGPSLGGVMVAAFGTASTMAINTVSYFVCAALTARVTAPPLHRQPSRLRQDLAEMWQIVADTRWLWINIACSAVGVACWHISYGIVGLAYVDRYLGGPAAWGMIASSLGVGMVCGAGLALMWRVKRGGWVNSLAVMPMALPSTAMAAAAPLWTVAAAVAVAAIGLAVASVVWRSLLQQQFPDQQQGRVSAATWIGELVLAPVAYLLVDPALEAFGMRGTLTVCSVGLLIAAVAPLTSRQVRGLRLAHEDTPACHDRRTALTKGVEQNRPQGR